MDIRPENNKDTFRGRGKTIEELRDQVNFLNEERERLIKKLEKIENLSRYAWEQVERKPEEAKELFKKIYTISSDEDTSKWYNCAHCDAGYPDQECTCESEE